MPVLYGVFLYMGVASLSGIQVRLVPAAAAVYRNKLIFFVCVCVAGHLTYINNRWEVIQSCQAGRRAPKVSTQTAEKTELHGKLKLWGVR